MPETDVAHQAELAVLGSMLIERAAAVRSSMELDAVDFYMEPNRLIFKAACDLLENEMAVDLTTVAERLRIDGKLEVAGGVAYIADTLQAVQTTAHLSFYTMAVKQASLQRQFKVQVKVTDAEPSSENVEKLQDLTLRINGEGVGKIIDCQSDEFRALVDEILDDPAQGFQTGFFSLDLVLNRIEPGDLVVIGARTSGGKTALMVQLAVNMAEQGVPAGIMTTEMDIKQVIKRILPMASGVVAGRFRSGSLTDIEKNAVRAAVVGKLAKMPLKIFAKPRMSLKDIRGFMVKSGCQVGFFDYLQRAQMKKGESRVYEIEEFMVGLKTLARGMGRAIVTAVQLDRGLDKNPTTPPELADLRGSGAIEAESDTVILLWRPPAVVSQKRLDWVEPAPGCLAIEAIIKKNRHGPAPRTVDLQLNEEMVAISERTLNAASKQTQGDNEEWYRG